MKNVYYSAFPRRRLYGYSIMQLSFGYGRLNIKNVINVDPNYTKSYNETKKQK